MTHDNKWQDGSAKNNREYKKATGVNNVPVSQVGWITPRTTDQAHEEWN